MTWGNMSHANGDLRELISEKLQRKFPNSHNIIAVKGIDEASVLARQPLLHLSFALHWKV